MPCRSEGPDDQPQVNRAEQQAKQREKEAQKKIDQLTRMLCTLMRGVNSRGYDFVVDLDIDSRSAIEITKWYETHQAWDRKRLAGARRSAISKLSDEELEALGLEREDGEE